MLVMLVSRLVYWYQHKFKRRVGTMSSPAIRAIRARALRGYDQLQVLRSSDSGSGASSEIPAGRHAEASGGLCRCVERSFTDYEGEKKCSMKSQAGCFASVIEIIRMYQRSCQVRCADG